MHRRWLSGLHFDQAVHHVVLEDLIAAVEAATERRDRLTKQIEMVMAGWSLAPLVRAIQALRCAAWRWSTRQRWWPNSATSPALPARGTSWRAYLGLVPSEHSSGGSRRTGGIPKAGNGAARRMLIEAAWSYRFPARISRPLLLRQEGLATSIRDAAWKAQLRLCRRYRKLANAGKPATVVTTAIARELAGFVWAIAHQAAALARSLIRSDTSNKGGALHY
jgi:transposase